MTTVAILPSLGDYATVLPRLLDLAEAEDLVRPGHSVLIKPNLHAAQHWTTAGTTNPALVAALIGWARAKGARRILVADSPFMGYANPEEVFISTGMAKAVEDAGAEWTVLTRHPYRIFRDASLHLPRELGISTLAFEFDRVINVALMKTHMDCLVTLGMKNFKGCIRNEDKKAFHNDVEINRAIVALNRLVSAGLTIIDGTLGMEGVGPHAGRPANFGRIFASRDVFAADVTVASAMGVEVEEARTLQYAVDEGMLDPAGIRVVGEEVGRIRRRFERPYEAMARELPGLRLQSDGACSACKLNVIRALRENQQAGLAPPERLVVIGNGVPSEGNALFLGRCARDHAAGRPCLAGCPPSVGKAREFLAAGASTAKG